LQPVKGIFRPCRFIPEKSEQQFSVAFVLTDFDDLAIHIYLVRIMHAQSTAIQKMGTLLSQMPLAVRCGTEQLVSVEVLAKTEAQRARIIWSPSGCHRAFHGLTRRRQFTTFVLSRIAFPLIHLSITEISDHLRC
jgi:hypothetical protein